MIDRLAACCECADDRQMLAIIKDLATRRDEREEASMVLLQALDLRPNWGPLLDPKEWRAEVTSCLGQLYGVTDLRRDLAAAEDPLAPHLDQALGVLFDSPLAIIGPVQDAKVTFQKFLPVACTLLETVVTTCASHLLEPEDIEARLHSIQSLDEGIAGLDACFKPSDCDLRRVASRLRDVLNNPEVALHGA